MWSHAHAKDIASNKGYYGVFPKEKGRFFMPTFSHIFFALIMIYYTLPCFFLQNLHQRQEFQLYNCFPTFWGKKWNLLFIYHYSLLLFTVSIHLYYSLRIFAYLRGVIPYISSKFWVCLVQDFFPRESHHLWAFLWEISLLTTTSLHLYYLYKACNS